MTPKFDNLASLLLETRGVRIPDETQQEIAEYIEEFPEVTYKDIAAAFEVSLNAVKRIAKSFEVSRGRERQIRHDLQPQAHAAKDAYHRGLKGSEKHFHRKLSDAQELQVLDYWLANHYETTIKELVRWISQQFGVISREPKTILKRASAKHNKPLPPPGYGKGSRLRKQRDDKRRHATDPTGVPTQRSHHFKGSASTTTSNTGHNPRQPPTPPTDQDKRL